MNANSPRVIEVSAGLLFRNGLLLITQRPAGTHLAGLWEFPGGKRHDDESFEACLVRELQEELAATVHVHEIIDELMHSYPEKTVHLKFYRCTLAAGEPKAIDCAAIAWVKQSELGNYTFPAADERLLEKLRNCPALWC